MKSSKNNDRRVKVMKMMRLFSRLTRQERLSFQQFKKRACMNLLETKTKRNGFILKIKWQDIRNHCAACEQLDAAANFHALPETFSPKGVMTQSHNVA